jgi:hypothetical protein
MDTDRKLANADEHGKGETLARGSRGEHDVQWLPGQPGRGMHRYEGPPQDDGGARTSRDRPLADQHLHSRGRHQTDLRRRGRGVLPQGVIR